MPSRTMQSWTSSTNQSVHRHLGSMHILFFVSEKEKKAGNVFLCDIDTSNSY
jgi:hypothetical protein